MSLTTKWSPKGMSCRRAPGTYRTRARPSPARLWGHQTDAELFQGPDAFGHVRVDLQAGEPVHDVLHGVPIPRFSDMPDNTTRSPSAPKLAKDGFACPTVSAKPSRSRPANHVLARC